MKIDAPKFRVGDRVKCINDMMPRNCMSPVWIKNGEIYTVRSTKMEGNFQALDLVELPKVADLSDTYSFVSDRFVLYHGSRKPSPGGWLTWLLGKEAK